MISKNFLKIRVQTKHTSVLMLMTLPETWWRIQSQCPLTRRRQILCVILECLCHLSLRHFFENGFLDNNPSINPWHIRLIVGVGGTHHAVIGVVNIDVKFGTLGLCYPFYIMEDLHHTHILRHVLMAAHN